MGREPEVYSPGLLPQLVWPTPWGMSAGRRDWALGCWGTGPVSIHVLHLCLPAVPLPGQILGRMGTCMV